MKLLHERYRIVSHLTEGGQGSLYVVFDQQSASHKMAKLYRHKPSRFLTPFFDADVKSQPVGSILEKVQQKLSWMSPQLRLHNFLKYQYRQLNMLNHSGILFPEEIILKEPYCIIMRLIKGGTLRSVLREKGCLTLEETGFYFAQLANILNYLHSNKVVHRDIKPENILIDSQGSIFLSDFDFAHFKTGWPRDYLLSSHYRNKGTGNYMSPEHLRGAVPHYGMDIYSTATMIYEALSGELPFGKPIKNRDNTKNFRPIKTLNKKQNATILQALDPNPSKRTACILRFYRDLFEA